MKFEVVPIKNEETWVDYTEMAVRRGVYKSNNTVYPNFISLGDGVVYFLYSTGRLEKPSGWKNLKFAFVSPNFTINTDGTDLLATVNPPEEKLVDHTTLPYNTVVKFGSHTCLITYSLDGGSYKAMVCLDDSSQTWSGGPHKVQVLGTLKRVD